MAALQDCCHSQPLMQHNNISTTTSSSIHKHQTTRNIIYTLKLPPAQLSYSFDPPNCSSQFPHLSSQFTFCSAAKTRRDRYIALLERQRAAKCATGVHPVADIRGYITGQSMTGFFSLGGSASTNPHQQQDLNPPPQTLPPHNNWFHQMIHEGNNNNANNNQFPASLLGFGVGPTTIKLSHDHHQSLPLAMMMMRSSSYGVTGSGSSDGRRGSVSCQDCGNQAKKECVHVRCRTCCKNRGFECQTHVKSTWVPAAKRRERQNQSQLQLKRLRHVDHHPNSTTNAAASNSSLGCSTSSTRLVPSPSALGGGGMEVGTSRLPLEVRSATVFKCVRVSPIDLGEDQQQLAYQTSVNIGGHLFRGILYDQGPEEYHQQQSHYNPTEQEGRRNINHLICNTEHGSYAVDPTTNVYQNANDSPNSFRAGASGGTHFFP